MSYLKLCQLVSQTSSQILYQEDCKGRILVNNPSYPLTLQCEIIDFGSEESFKTNGVTTSFRAVSVVIPSAPVADSIRQTVYDQLIVSYPTLVI